MESIINTEFRHLSIRFCAESAEDDVCLILCDPTPEEVVGILESLVSLCPAAVPAHLASLALSCLRPSSPSATWCIVDSELFSDHKIEIHEEDLILEEEDEVVELQMPPADSPLDPALADVVICDDGLDVVTMTVEVEDSEILLISDSEREEENHQSSRHRGSNLKMLANNTESRPDKGIRIALEQASDNRPSGQHVKIPSKLKGRKSEKGVPDNRPSRQNVKMTSKLMRKSEKGKQSVHSVTQPSKCTKSKSENGPSSAEEKASDDGQKRRRKPKPTFALGQGYHSLPPSAYNQPERQVLLDQLAFRKKYVMKGDRSAICSECGAGNFTEMALRSHLQKAHNFAPCKACCKLFPSKEIASNHGCPLRNLKCDQCPRTFTSLDGWFSHKKHTHEGLNLVCQVCGQQLATNQSLRVHLETVHGILPALHGRQPHKAPGEASLSHHCDKCGRQYPNRIRLREHILNIHGGQDGSGLGQYTCELCGRCWPTKHTLRKHMYKKHGVKKTKEDSAQ